MGSTGETIVVNDQEYLVVWNGEEGLIPERETKVGPGWSPPNRQYNKTGKHKRKVESQLELGTQTLSTFGEDND